MEDIVVFSHLRWNFVFQRPQHIMSELAATYRVIFIEEEIISNEGDGYRFSEPVPDILVITPLLHSARSTAGLTERRQAIVDTIMNELNIRDYALWYYTPMAYAFSRHLQPRIIVYDCMDELSAFLFAPPELKRNEADLLDAADIVFTGGLSLYEAKKNLHDAVYCMPSSIDKEHFAKARMPLEDPGDQAGLPFPRFGFFGVIDERFDTSLLREVAKKKPVWQFIILGPVVKINEEDLPDLPNIHYLGMKSYGELPSYLSNWQVAFLPFAINESTRYISPTKTPEYLAAGKPVISTPVKDVTRTYGERGLVAIAADADEFIRAGERLLVQEDEKWLPEVDNFLSNRSWAGMVMTMNEYIRNALTTTKEKV